MSPAWPTDLVCASWQSLSSLSPTYLALDWGQTLWVSGVLELDRGGWWPDHQSGWNGGGLVQPECWTCAQLSRKPNKHCIQNQYTYQSPELFKLIFSSNLLEIVHVNVRSKIFSVHGHLTFLKKIFPHNMYV